MTFDESAINRDQTGRFAEKTGTASEISLVEETPLDPVLVEALDRYGITVADVPLDHEGQSIVDRWATAFASREEEQLTTIEEHINAELNVDYGRLQSGPRLAWPEVGVPLEKWPSVRNGDDWEGRSPVAVVHTRNGGGNRHCYCDHDYDTGVTDHAPHCTARAVEIMEAHPAHLTNEDNSFDSTYADFAFRVDRKAAKELFKTSAIARQQENARLRYEAIRQGRTAPWAVFPPNPRTLERIEEMNAEAEELDYASLLKDNKLPSGLRFSGLPDKKHLDSLNAKLAILDGDKGMEDSARNVWQYDKYTGLAKERENYEKAVEDGEAAVAAQEALADPNTSPALARALTLAMEAPFGLSYSAKKVGESEARMKAKRAAIVADRDVVAAVLQRREMQEYIRRERTHLSQNTTWPGDGPAPEPVG